MQDLLRRLAQSPEISYEDARWATRGNVSGTPLASSRPLSAPQVF